MGKHVSVDREVRDLTTGEVDELADDLREWHDPEERHFVTSYSVRTRVGPDLETSWNIEFALAIDEVEPRDIQAAVDTISAAAASFEHVPVDADAIATAVTVR